MSLDRNQVRSQHQWPQAKLVPKSEWKQQREAAGLLGTDGAQGLNRYIRPGRAGRFKPGSRRVEGGEGRPLPDLQTNKLEALFLRNSQKGPGWQEPAVRRKDWVQNHAAWGSWTEKAQALRGDRARKTQKLEDFRWNTFKHFTKSWTGFCQPSRPSATEEKKGMREMDNRYLFVSRTVRWDQTGWKGMIRKWRRQEAAKVNPNWGRSKMRRQISEKKLKENIISEMKTKPGLRSQLLENKGRRMANSRPGRATEWLQCQPRYDSHTWSQKLNKTQNQSGDSEMALQGKVLVTKPDDPSVTPGTHVVEENGPHKLSSDLRPDNMCTWTHTKWINTFRLFVLFCWGYRTSRMLA